MADLREIQLAELEILKYFDHICSKLGLKYSLCCGTMLGAVRHGGFIPWDDDVDTFISLSDYKVLRKHFKSEEFFLQEPSTDIEASYSMSKIRKRNTYMPEEETVMLNIRKGIWIDLFLYTDAAKSERMRSAQYRVYNILQTYRCRYLHIAKNDARAFHKVCARLPKIFQVALDRFFVWLVKSFGSKKSDSYFCFGVGKVYFYKRELFDNLVRYRFEDADFWGIRDYDAYLKMSYGDDYMAHKKWGHIDSYDDVIV